MMMPAAAGPTARATLTRTVLSETAFRRSFGPTISNTNVCRAGFSKVLLRPRITARTPICHSVIVWVSVKTPNTSAWTPISDWSTTISLCLLTRSATTPPYGPSSRIGKVCKATTRPTSNPEPVRCSTRKDCATVCIQVPVSEIA